LSSANDAERRLVLDEDGVSGAEVSSGEPATAAPPKLTKFGFLGTAGLGFGTPVLSFNDDDMAGLGGTLGLPDGLSGRAIWSPAGHGGRLFWRCFLRCSNVGVLRDAGGFDDADDDNDDEIDVDKLCARGERLSLPVTGGDERGDVHGEWVVELEPDVDEALIDA
jgi:hypothetical protein